MTWKIIGYRKPEKIVFKIFFLVEKYSFSVVSSLTNALFEISSLFFCSVVASKSVIVFSHIDVIWLLFENIIEYWDVSKYSSIVILFFPHHFFSSRIFTSNFFNFAQVTNIFTPKYCLLCCIIKCREFICYKSSRFKYYKY